jgi:hypothetical protein
MCYTIAYKLLLCVERKLREGFRQPESFSLAVNPNVHFNKCRTKNRGARASPSDVTSQTELAPVSLKPQAKTPPTGANLLNITSRPRNCYYVKQVKNAVIKYRMTEFYTF